MKKMNIVSTIILLCAALGVASCDSWLEEEYFGAPTEKDMLRSESNVILMVGQAYADVKWLHDHWGYWGINTLTSDECVCPTRTPGNHWADGGYWTGMNNHTWTARSAAFENLWNQSVAGAVLCNKIIQTLTNNRDIVGSKYEQYKAELEVLRSYYFFTLFDSFGKIPYTEEFAENTQTPLMSASEVWNKLVACLERNAPYMPKITDGNRTQYYGRVSKGFAHALLARLYLNAESYGVNDGTTNYYSKCSAYCDSIIVSESYTIEDDFFTNFKIQNENSKENIFVIVEDGNEKFDARSSGSMSNKLRIVPLTLHYAHQQAWDLLEKPWNGFCAPHNFIDMYDENDKRGPGNEERGTQNQQQWGWFVGQVYDAAGSPLNDENGERANIVKTISSLTESKWYEGARLLKYEVDKTQTYKFCENDFVLFRYADVLYMKCEATIRETGSAGSILDNPHFKRIRQRAGLQPYDALTTNDLDELLNERGREFAWENVRRRDLIRYGKFVDGSWSGWGEWRGVRSAAHLKWFPIPQAILDKSHVGEDGNHIWTQNDGY